MSKVLAEQLAQRLALQLDLSTSATVRGNGPEFEADFGRLPNFGRLHDRWVTATIRPGSHIEVRGYDLDPNGNPDRLVASELLRLTQKNNFAVGTFGVIREFMEELRLPGNAGHDDAAGIINLLRHERIRRGITQRDLARVLGVSGAAVTTWETGARQPSASRLAAWLQALDMQLSYRYLNHP